MLAARSKVTGVTIKTSTVCFQKWRIKAYVPKNIPLLFMYSYCNEKREYDTWMGDRRYKMRYEVFTVICEYIELEGSAESSSQPGNSLTIAKVQMFDRCTKYAIA